MNPPESKATPFVRFDDWDRTIAAHFFIAYTQKPVTAVGTDLHLYLVEPLLCLSSKETSSLYYLSILQPIIGQTTPDPLLSFLYDLYIKSTGREPTGLILHKTSRTTRFRAFTESLGDESAIVDVWTGCSAVCAALSILLAQWDAMCKTKGKNEVETLGEKVMALNRLVKGWHAHGEITFDQQTQLNIDSAHSRRIRTAMLDALLFIIAHELGHHFLGHVSANRNKRPSQNERHRQEFDADRDGASALIMATSNTLNMGPILAFMAASLLSKGSDTEATPTHPPLVDRVNAYLDHLSAKHSNLQHFNEWREGYVKSFMKTVFGNIEDRDRLPDWFGFTSAQWKEALARNQSIPSGRAPMRLDDFKPNSFSPQFADATRPQSDGRQLPRNFI